MIIFIIALIFQYIQIAYFTLALLNDVFPTPAIKKTKDIIFAGLTIPFAFKTTLMYFGISFIDPELVFPAALRPHFPTWLDITLHSSISVFPIFEILLTRPQFTYRWTSIKVLITGLISYSIWIHVVYFKTGKWVYDIFAELNDIERTVFFAASGIVGIGLYFIGELLSFLLVGSQTKKKQKKSKKSK